MVMTPWEYAIWLCEASKQNVDWTGLNWTGYPLDCYDY